MADDFDQLDDIFADEAAKKARAVGKFQPKPKFQPQKKGSNVAPDDNTDSHAVMEKPVGKNVDILTGPEALSDRLPQTSTGEDCSFPSSEAVLSSAEDSTSTCKGSDVPLDPGVPADVVAITGNEPIVSSADVQTDMHDRELGREEMDMDVLDSLNMTDLTSKSAKRMRKFQPKPKPQLQKKIQACESVSDSLGSQSVPPDIDYSQKDLVPTSQQDDVLDLSSLGLTHTLPTEGTSELPLNEESMNAMEVAQLDSFIHLDDMPEVPAKLASRRAKTGDSKTHSASDPSPQQRKGSILTKENGTGRSLRPRKGKTNFCELVDEDQDEVIATGENSEECPPIEEENINNEPVQVESEPQKKNVKRKSKKTDDGNEKPTKKGKKGKEESDREGAKRKKFSHSTRRRQANKTLLETPEDEIDYQRVAIRDLIQLAEHKEREMKKGGTAEGAPATNQSTGNSSGPYNDENFTSEQGGEDNGEQDTPMVDTTEYFNYHHYMERTSKTRWSKQETELFYKAVQQFGTDFSMIEMVFPSRSRREIKLKYKKEERQHPLRLREALTSRSEDVSLFQMVKEHLQKYADEENRNAGEDDVIDVGDDEGADEGVPNADDDKAKEEHTEEEEEHATVADGSTEVQTPLKPDDDEDDFLRWSQYKSDI